MENNKLIQLLSELESLSIERIESFIDNGLIADYTIKKYLVRLEYKRNVKEQTKIKTYTEYRLELANKYDVTLNTIKNYIR